MRLFEAIIEANHRAVAGDKTAGLCPAEFEDSLPVVALTCIDERLNPLIPEVFGIPEEDFIWVRNAGNIVSGPFSSTMRSLAVGATIKGAREVVIVGHTDCLMGKITMTQVLERLAAAGVPRAALPEDLVQFFGIFSGERQNVIRACSIVRRSPLISPQVPVHGLMLDLETGKLDWVVNGYQTFETAPDRLSAALQKADFALGKVEELGKFTMGEMRFPETKIGEAVSTAQEWLGKAQQFIGATPLATPQPATGASEPPKPQAPPSGADRVSEFVAKHWPRPAQEEPESSAPPKLPVPPPIRMRMDFRKGKKQ